MGEGSTGQCLYASTSPMIQSAVGFINTDAIWGIKGNPSPPVPQISDQSKRGRRQGFWPTLHTVLTLPGLKKATAACLALSFNQPSRQEESVAHPVQRCQRLLPVPGPSSHSGWPNSPTHPPSPTAQPTGQAQWTLSRGQGLGAPVSCSPCPPFHPQDPGHTRRKMK